MVGQLGSYRSCSTFALAIATLKLEKREFLFDDGLAYGAAVEPDPGCVDGTPVP